jgi:hypothetical protein
LEKVIIFFPKPPKSVKATGEAFQPYKENSQPLKPENSYLFYFLLVIFALLGPDLAD